MIDSTRVLQKFTVVFLGLFAGAMCLIAVSLMPYWSAQDPTLYRESFKALGPFLGTSMVPLMGTSIALSLLCAISFRGRRALWWGVSCGVFLIIPLYAWVHGPVNAQLLSNEVLTATQIAALQKSWFFWHWVRTAFGTASFLLALFAMEKK